MVRVAVGTARVAVVMVREREREARERPHYSYPHTKHLRERTVQASDNTHSSSKQGTTSLLHATVPIFANSKLDL